MIFGQDNFKTYRDNNGIPYESTLYSTMTTKILGSGQSYILSFPKVLQEVRYHFDCPQLDGVYLENEVADESSKWRYLDKGLFFNEISTNSIKYNIGDILFQKPILSKITIALLQDSHWYTEVDIQNTDTLFWGKRKGCKFINQQKSEYAGGYTKEFCQTQSDEGVQTNNNFGKGTCQADSLTNTLKYYKYQQASDICDYKNGQRMFMHTKQNVKSFLCYNVACQQTDTAVLWKLKIEQQNQSGIYFYCETPGEKISMSDQSELYCPDDFIGFCATYSLYCKDDCSSKGLCIGGKCFCHDSSFGTSCQCNSSTSKYYSFIDGCVNECKQDEMVVESEKICIKQICNINDSSWSNCQECSSSQTSKCQTCKKGYAQINGLCQQCGVKGCSVCQQNPKNKCTTCQDGKILFEDSQCVDICPYGYYSKVQIDKSKKCIKCHADCKNCVGPNNSDCTICSNPDDSVFACSTDSNGNVVCNKNGVCKKCPADYYYIEVIEFISQICKPCESSCQKCKGPLDTDCIQCKLDSTQLTQQKFIDSLNTLKCIVCPTGQYGDSADYKCKQCNTECKECIGLTNKDCLSCKSAGYYIRQDEGVCKDCPANGFYIEENVCKKCHPLCKTCKGPYVTDCLTCASDGTAKPTCVQCQSGFYYDNNSLKCLACHDSCDECIGGTEKDCTTCAFKLFIRQNPLNQSLCGTCDSTKNEYANSQYNKCMSCHSSCNTCLGSLPSQCISCSQSGFYKDTNYNLVCRQCTQAQYVNKDNVCLNCHSSCLSCKGPLETDCLTCRDKNHSILTTGGCGACKEGEYKDLNNYCKPCSSNCLGCIAENVCTSCKPSTESKLIYLNYDGQCLEDCQTGTYKDSTQKLCNQCDSTCKECSGPKINECSSCYDNGYVTSTKTCDYCSTGQYYKEDVNGCALCNQTCETCKDKADQCILCAEGYYKNSVGKCDQQCKQNEIKVEIDPSTNERVRRCDKCHQSCQTCYGTSQFQCLACKDEYYRVEDTNECVGQCPTLGYFTDGTQCLKCQANCISCSNSDTCNECATGYSLFNKLKCVQQCPESMYSKDKVCLSCLVACKTCTAIDKCQSCNNPYYLSVAKSTCGDSCSIGEFKDAVNFKCLSCKPNCKECSGPPNFTCITCLTGSKRLDGTCGDCDSGQYSQNGSCAICNNSCLECFGSGTDQCRSCKQGYFLSGSKCYQCTTQNCKVCTAAGSSSVCKSCVSNYYLNDSSTQCLTTCPSQQYGDSATQTCKKCGQNCRECTERRGCTQCLLATQYKVRDTFNCVDKCSTTDYVQDDNNKECVKKVCSVSNCESCDYINQICKKCLDGYNIASQSKLCIKCGADEYFYYQFERCVKTNEYCDAQCLTCNGPTSLDCIECKMKYKQERSGKFYCVDSCDSNFYPDQSSKSCKPCFKYNNQCLQKCPSKTFANNQQCQDCDKTCSECKGATSTNCLSCISNYLLWQDNSCQQFCPSNQCSSNGKCVACTNPDDGNTPTDSSSSNETYLSISQFECSDNCEREETYATRIGNLQKVTSIIEVGVSLANFAALNIDGFISLQQTQQIGNLVFGQNSGQLGVGGYQLKHSFMSNFINWIPNTFLDISESSSSTSSTQSSSSSGQTSRLLESSSSKKEISIQLYSSEVADKLKINNFNKYFYQNCFFLLIILACLIFTYFSSRFLEFNRVERFIKWNGALCFQFVFSNFLYVSIIHAFQVDSPGERRDDFDLFLASFVLIGFIAFLIYQAVLINTKSIISLDDDEENENKSDQTSNDISLITYHIQQYRLLTRNYWIFYEFRKLLNSILVIATKGHKGAIWALVFVNLLFLLYTIFAKPFTVLRYQRMSIFKELMMTLIFATFAFSISLSQEKGGLTFAYITSILLVINFIISILFCLYSLYRRFYPDQEDLFNKSLQQEQELSPPKKEAELMNFDGQLSSISSIPMQDRLDSNNNDTTNKNNFKKLFKSTQSINYYAPKNQNFLNSSYYDK